jgi:vacuolar-type H+-ATPase subunit I/STV1
MPEINETIEKLTWKQEREIQEEARQKAEEMLKQDPEIQAMLKEKILAYDDELHHIEYKRRELIKRLEERNASEFDKYFLLKCFDELFEGRRAKSLEKGLKNMIYSLKKARGRLREKTEWHEKYERAQRTCIECVVHHFHPDAANIRNIKQQMLRCPFHDDKSPSMKVYLPDNNFHCFGCGAHGSPIDFVMKIKNCDFKEAVEIISYL